MSDAVTELKRLRDALSASGDVAYDWDLATDSITWLNAAGSFDAQSPLYAVHTGKAYDALIHPEDLAQRNMAIEQLTASAADYECEFRLSDAEDDHRWFHDRGVAEFSADGNPIRLRGILRPVTMRKLNGARLDYFANYDALTGHYNRARLREALEHSLFYSRRYDVQGAYLVIGIDKLAMVNEAFGHEAADEVIFAIGDRLDRCLRACDIIGRIGGDRFGAVLGNCPESELVRITEKILEAARAHPVDTDVGPVHVTVSIGAVTFPAPVGAATDVMTKAEFAMQNAKRSGRDCYVRYDCTEEEQLNHRDNMVIAEQVQRAMREKRMAFAYQPIVDSATKKPIHYECLLRMVQPDGEVVAAGRFMPVVENLGMIRPIDRMVLELAVEQLTEHPDVKLAVNVSGLTTRDHSWMRAAIALLRGKPDIAKRLQVEITETAGLEDIDACAQFVTTLRDLGCEVALDDFGAGYTSFRHLKQLPVTMVKIDGSFVRNIGENPDNLVFVRTLIDLANNFGLETVAECVETEEEAELLAREGVNYLQGYAFGKPEMELPWEAPAAKKVIRRKRAGRRTQKAKSPALSSAAR